MNVDVIMRTGRPSAIRAIGGLILTIWESFIEFLEDVIRRFGLVKLLIALAAFAGALLGLGFVVSPETLIRIALLFIIALLLLTCLALIIDRHRLRSTISDGTEVLNRYGDEIVARQTADSFDIKEWRDEQYIDKNGDTTICRRFTLVVGNEPLETFWHTIYMSPERTDVKYRKKLTIEAKKFDPPTLQPGVNYLYSSRWEQHALRLFVHLDRAYQPGQEVYVYLEVFWPQFCKKLLENRQGDNAEWMFRRNAEKLHVIMSFDKGLRIRENFAIQPLLPSCPACRLTQTRLPGGTIKIEFEYDNPPRDTLVGFTVQRTAW